MNPGNHHTTACFFCVFTFCRMEANEINHKTRDLSPGNMQGLLYTCMQYERTGASVPHRNICLTSSKNTEGVEIIRTV